MRLCIRSGIAVVVLLGSVAILSADIKAFTGARIIDGTGAAPIARGTVIVENGRVKTIGPERSVSVPAGAQRIDVAGKTIARHLVERMFEYFREEGFDAVEGTTDRTNGPALIFYRTCGFQIEERGFEDGAKVQVRYAVR